MEPLIAVYDACVLYPNFLRDFLVCLAIHGRSQGILRVKWTGRIHREWVRVVLRHRPDLRGALSRTRRLMDQHVRGCRVRGYERWEQRLALPDADDRHVLAAALACVADAIVTFNTDVPPLSLGLIEVVDRFVVGFHVNLGKATVAVSIRIRIKSNVELLSS
ncbi:MAG: PIN domain-containing protein [Gemmataceae bacterium]|nr:PIN domain-containing protein [Gemmataceae bacterium]